MNNELVKFIVYNWLLTEVTYLRVMYPNLFLFWISGLRNWFLKFGTIYFWMKSL